MPSRPSLKLSEVLKRLKRFGVVTVPGRGKGSERVLLLPNSPGSKQGDIFTIADHGKSTVIGRSAISAMLRRFGIDPDEFWA